MRRPWNIIDIPVYSLATYDGVKLNMNICTYVSPVSMNPKQYCIAVYYNTQTHLNLQYSKTAVLQILSKPNINLVKTLGKKSGLIVNKNDFLKKEGLLTTWHGFKVLKDVAAYILLEKIKSTDSGGDHETYFFTAKRFKTISEKNILMFQDLIENKIIL